MNRYAVLVTYRSSEEVFVDARDAMEAADLAVEKARENILNAKSYQTSIETDVMYLGEPDGQSE